MWRGDAEERSWPSWKACTQLPLEKKKEKENEMDKKKGRGSRNRTLLIPTNEEWKCQLRCLIPTHMLWFAAPNLFDSLISSTSQVQPANRTPSTFRLPTQQPQFSYLIRITSHVFWKILIPSSRFSRMYKADLQDFRRASFPTCPKLSLLNILRCSWIVCFKIWVSSWMS